MCPPRCLLLSALLAASPAARAVIVSGPEDDNLSAPANGAPWQYVARLDISGVADASAVYLGYGYLLTANHVNPPTSAFLNGIAYAIDSSYAPLQSGGADIKLLRIIGDPGLNPLALIGSADDDTGTASTLIGWGGGKGSAVGTQGWSWGGARVERWGTNTTLASTVTSGGQVYLQTTFDRAAGNDEAALALGDSGSGLFQKFGSTWKLAGITSSVETNGQSLYDHDTVTSGDQPDHNYFVRIKPYAATIAAAIPEPGSGALLALGAACFGLARRRQH